MGRIVDARGLSCPQPVILTKKAMDESKGGDITTIVDNTTALENVTKLAGSQGYEFQVENRSGDYYISMSKAAETAGEETISVQEDIAILVTSNLFGQGDVELGRVLMNNFAYTLTQMANKVKHIIFMNSGVFLTTEGSEIAAHLAALENSGVEILSCGTCLDFYGLKDKLVVGKVTNMYTAMEILTAAAKSINL